MESITSIEDKVNEYLITQGISPKKANGKQITEAYDKIQLEDEKRELRAIRRRRIKEFWSFKWIEKEDLIVAVIWVAAAIALIALIWHINK